MANDRDVTLILIYILFFSKNCKKAKRKLYTQFNYPNIYNFIEKIESLN